MFTQKSTKKFGKEKNAQAYCQINMIYYLGAFFRPPFLLFCSSYLLTKRAPLRSGRVQFDGLHNKLKNIAVFAE